MGVMSGITGELGDMPFSIDMRSLGSFKLGTAVGPLVTIRMAGGGEGVEVREDRSGEVVSAGTSAGSAFATGPDTSTGTAGPDFGSGVDADATDDDGVGRGGGVGVFLVMSCITF